MTILSARPTTAYYPGLDRDWARRDPREVGLDADALAEASAYALAHESPFDHDLAKHLTDGLMIENMPDRELVGPTKPRGPANGLVVRHGYIAHEWGDTQQIDMTFSVTKSYLATVVGLAWDRGLIRDIDDRVRDYVDDGGFDSIQNAPITWRMLLQQTSEWSGALWDKSHEVDRPGSLGRPLQKPGTFFEYNDVRVNRLSLAALRVWRQALPAVFKALVADPIGCSPEWVWHGYRNSWVDIDGQSVQSVSGGGHWGGGFFIHARDQARFGLLFARRGAWQGRRLISERWIQQMIQPCALNPHYGFLWWVNHDGGFMPSAPRDSYGAMGAGANIIWIDPANDLVVVSRWIDRDHRDGLLKRVYAALR